MVEIIEGLLEWWLGSSGKTKRTVLNNLMRLAPNKKNFEGIHLGLTGPELWKMLGKKRIENLLMNRTLGGNIKAIIEVLWWGSAIGDLCLDGDCIERHDILREAALFNLGVVLFDTVVDEEKEKRTTLMNTINPSTIRRKIYYQLQDDSELIKNQEELLMLNSIFDEVLLSIGKRFRYDRNKKDEIYNLLIKMYNSELGISGGSVYSKQLPVVFLGCLSETDHAVKFKKLYESLSQFICYWDDWLDLAKDIVSLSPNTFLTMEIDNKVLERLVNIVLVFCRIIFGPVLHRSINNRMSTALNNVIIEARRIGSLTEKKTMILLSIFIRRLPDPDRFLALEEL